MILDWFWFDPEFFLELSVIQSVELAIPHAVNRQSLGKLKTIHEKVMIRIENQYKKFNMFPG